MIRRAFASVALLSTVALTSARSVAAEDKYLETIKVADDVYVFKPKIDWTHGNGVAIIGPDGVFFIDTYQQNNYAEEAIRRLKRLTPLPVRYVLNTHWHWDHVMGNGVFKRIYPDAKIIAHDSTAGVLAQRLKGRIDGELANVAADLAQVDSQIARGMDGTTPIVGTMKPFWQLMRQELIEYQKDYRKEQYFPADITFSDSLTMRWGQLTLRMIHMGDNGHSAGDAVLWIPEHRLLVTGDLVVAPTPYATYYNSPGMPRAINKLIAMNPSIIVPGHGEIERDTSYMHLLVRAFTAYRKAAEGAKAAGIPRRQAIDSIRFPEIDRAFTGDDPLKAYGLTSWFRTNLIYLTYQPPAGAKPPSSAPPG